MESETNPYASPAILAESTVASTSDNDSQVEFPVLPITFRTPAETLTILIPIGVGLGILFLFTIVLFSIAPYQQGYSHLGGPAAAVFAIFTAVAAFGCLIALRCRIIVSQASIEVVDVGRQLIFYTEITSWRQQNSTGTIYVAQINQRKQIPISNWAMSKNNSDLLAKVLRKKVGPPSND